MAGGSAGHATVRYLHPGRSDVLHWVAQVHVDLRWRRQTVAAEAAGCGGVLKSSHRFEERVGVENPWDIFRQPRQPEHTS